MLASDMVDRLARIEAKLDDVSDRVARMEGRAEAETTGVRRSPLVEDGPRGWDRLAAWLAGWSPWQVLIALALIVGGPTVAGPTVDRVLSVFLPDVHAIEAAPTKPPKPADGNDDAAGILDTVTDTADDLATPRPLP
jgi:hypothetical protein